MAGYKFILFDADNTLFDFTRSEREAVAEVTSEQAEGKTVRPASGSAAQSGVVSPDGKTVKKVGRNDPCPCGSGKKYKKCCGRGDNSAE